MCQFLANKHGLTIALINSNVMIISGMYHLLNMYICLRRIVRTVFLCLTLNHLNVQGKAQLPNICQSYLPYNRSQCLVLAEVSALSTGLLLAVSLKNTSHPSPSVRTQDRHTVTVKSLSMGGVASQDVLFWYCPTLCINVVPLFMMLNTDQGLFSHTLTDAPQRWRQRTDGKPSP